jgi:16S rRNA C967 or C1407 C5-methylase (RsmB/RsmF family)
MASKSQKAAPITLPPSVAALLGDEANALLDALGTEVPVSVRLNPDKPIQLEGTPIPWCGSGRYLPQRPVFTLDPRLHAGCYYVQEASSMLVEQAFARTGLAEQPIAALDLCAAPGGKSTHLASLLSPASLLVCNEPVPARRQILQENLWKQGRANTVITGSQPAAFAQGSTRFDLILVDAPCSGEGMFRKDPFARQQWNERLVITCARTQADILQQAWNALTPGGWLIYSTCTWERAENEEQIQRLLDLGAEPITIPIEEDWGVERTELGLRCYPHRVRGEGFFIGLLWKPGERAIQAAMTSAVLGTHPWLDPQQALRLIELGTQQFASPAAWHGVVDQLCADVNMVAPGIPMAERKGAGWRPHPALALNGVLNSNAFTRMDVTLDDALRYLRGETAFPAGSNVATSSGVQLVCYEGHALGWLHAAGNRWNNGSLKEWRIRMH